MGGRGGSRVFLGEAVPGLSRGRRERASALPGSVTSGKTLSYPSTPVSVSSSAKAVRWPGAQTLTRLPPATAPRRGTCGGRLSPRAVDSPLETGRGLGRTEGRTPAGKPGTQLARAPEIPGGRATPAASPRADPGAGPASGLAVSGRGGGVGGTRARGGAARPAHRPRGHAPPRPPACTARPPRAGPKGPSPSPPAARAPPSGHGTRPRGPSARGPPGAALALLSLGRLGGSLSRRGPSPAARRTGPGTQGEGEGEGLRKKKIFHVFRRTWNNHRKENI